MAPKTKLVAFHPVHGYKIKPQQDLKTIKRNERERKRVETVNRGFETLRQHVPTASQIKKLSKVSILTEAMDYIQYLCNSLQHTPASEPVLINFTPTCPPASPGLYQPPMTPMTPLTPQSPYQVGPHSHNQHSDQGFYSDYSQHSPAAWQPQPQYKHQPYFIPKQEPQYTPHHEPRYTPRHEPQYTPKQEPQYTPRHEPQYTPQQHEAQCTPNNKVQPQFVVKQEVLSPHHLQYPQSAATEEDGESSGEEDDILDAIAEWQQL